MATVVRSSVESRSPMGRHRAGHGNSSSCETRSIAQVRMVQKFERMLHRFMPAYVRPVYNLVSFSTTRTVTSLVDRNAEDGMPDHSVALAVILLVIGFLGGTFI